MRLWLRVRRLRVLLTTIAGLVATVVLAGGIQLPVPNLLGGARLGVPLGLLVPLAAPIVIAWGLSSGDSRLEGVASRPMRLFDTAFAVGGAGLTLAACLLAYAGFGTSVAAAAGRATLGYVGLMLIGRSIIGPMAAPLIPTGFAVFTALFGLGAMRRPRPWAWPLHDVGDPAAWAVAMGILVVGTLAGLRYPAHRFW